MSRSNSHITDIMKLGMTDFKVEESGGVWNVRVELPDDYPYKSPSIGFVTKIYNPNIDESSGSIYLNILNQEWSPCLDLEKLFYVCLSQLLKDPNPDDPLNHEATALMMQDRTAYEKGVREYCERYAKPEEVVAEESEEDRTDNEYESSDDNVAENELEVARVVSKMSFGEED